MPIKVKDRGKTKTLHNFKDLVKWEETHGRKDGYSHDVAVKVAGEIEHNAREAHERHLKGNFGL